MSIITLRNFSRINKTRFLFKQKRNAVPFVQSNFKIACHYFLTKNPNVPFLQTNLDCIQLF